MKMTMTVHTCLTSLFFLCRGIIDRSSSFGIRFCEFVAPCIITQDEIPNDEMRTTSYERRFSTLMNASDGISTFPFPMLIILAFPFFCFSSTLRFRVTSPP